MKIEEMNNNRKFERKEANKEQLRKARKIKMNT